MNMEEGISGMPDIHLRKHVLGNRHHQLLHCSSILDGVYWSDVPMPFGRG